MIIYKDIITGDELFSDIYKITEKGCLIEVEGKTVTRIEGQIDDKLIGGNASEDCPEEVNESTAISGADFVLNHKLQETGFNKKGYSKYIKDYMKEIKDILTKDKSERLEVFMATAEPDVKKILANFNNYQFFTGESMNPRGAVGLLDYREDGRTPFIIFFKDGLEMEKC